jgi:hypothetical protein
MDATITVALIIALSSVMGPLALFLLTNRAHREERKEDLARDEKKSKQVNSQLKAIHTLVNSNMTSAIQESLDSIRRELDGLERIIKLERAAGRDPSVEMLAAVRVAELRISELELKLEDRRKQAELVAAQELLAKAEKEAADE